MKVLFYRYGSVCEPDIIEAFKELGVAVVEETTEITKKNLIPSEVVSLVNLRLQKENVDFIFSVNFFPAISEVCRIYRIPYVSWTVDCPVLELFTKSVKNECNRIFLFDKQQYEDIRQLNPNCVYYLPLAANVSHKEKVIKQASKSLKCRFKSKISFVGSLYTEKSPYDMLDKKKVPKEMIGFLEGLMAAQELVYGYYFTDEVLTDEFSKKFAEYCPNFRPSYSNLHDEDFLKDKILLSQFYLGNGITARERLHIAKSLENELTIYTASNTSSLKGLDNRGTVKTLEEMPIVFSESSVNLNMTSRAIRSGLPFRIFDVLSCGGFLLTNYQPELQELFNIGEELVYYGSIDELREKALYYADDARSAQRREIAENGLKAIKERHTFPIRIEQMLRAVFV